MFTLRYFSTKTAGWVEAIQSADAREVVAKFDEVAGQRTIPCVELLLEEKVVLRLGLNKATLMKVGVWSTQVRGAKPAVKERYFKARARGVKKVNAGRRRLLDELVV
jgi:hypothetical protein